MNERGPCCAACALAFLLTLPLVNFQYLLMIFGIPQKRHWTDSTEESVRMYRFFLIIRNHKVREILKSHWATLSQFEFHTKVPFPRLRLDRHDDQRKLASLSALSAFSSFTFQGPGSTASHDRPSLIRFCITSAPKPLLLLLLHTYFTTQS